jgi:hypothetical protein
VIEISARGLSVQRQNFASSSVSAAVAISPAEVDICQATRISSNSGEMKRNCLGKTGSYKLECV